MDRLGLTLRDIPCRAACGLAPPEIPEPNTEPESTMRVKSIPTEAKQIERAVQLIHPGARLQVLESETDLSHERLLRLYKEVSGRSPSKGQLPFSTDWFMTWQPNIHASLFLNIHEYLNKAAELDEIDTVIKAYQLYPERRPGPEAMLGDARLAPGEVRGQRHADADHAPNLQMATS